MFQIKFKKKNNSEEAARNKGMCIPVPTFQYLLYGRITFEAQGVTSIH